MPASQDSGGVDEKVMDSVRQDHGRGAGDLCDLPCRFPVEIPVMDLVMNWDAFRLFLSGDDIDRAACMQEANGDTVLDLHTAKVVKVLGTEWTDAVFFRRGLKEAVVLLVWIGFHGLEKKSSPTTKSGDEARHG